MTRHSIVLLSKRGSLNSDRYRHARELVYQAGVDLTRLDPDDSLENIAVIDAHIARAALDFLASNIVNVSRYRPAPSWDDIGTALGLSPKKAKALVVSYLEDPGQADIVTDHSPDPYLDPPDFDFEDNMQSQLNID